MNFLRIIRGLELTALLIILAAVTGYSTPSPGNPVEKVRAYTRDIEFNYAEWMADAALVKMRAASIQAPHIFDPETQVSIVETHLDITQAILTNEYLLAQLYADPAITDKESASEDVRAELAALYTRQTELAPLAEAILQEQVASVLADLGLTAAGQPIPNVRYHSTPLPMALIVSPRERISQTANISVYTELTLDEQVALETHVEEGLGVSSLVVNIGGVGVYPTMVMRTTNLNWMVNTIAHEWIHNYLTFRPLGLFYGSRTHPEVRTMNETTASIAGDEIGALVIEKYYPDRMPNASRPTVQLAALPGSIPNPGDLPRPPFDFRAQMHETRLTVDSLLAEGKIEEAEAYMEERRQVFLRNGYLLRKINQAYFAFHGAYAASPGGAAGQDPIGPAVRELRAQSSSLAKFVKRIAWMWDFEQLQKAVGQ